MRSLDQIRNEIAGLSRPDAVDIVRRKYLAQLVQVTNRPTVVFAVDFINPNPFKIQFAGSAISISLADKEAFDEITRNIEGDCLDVVVHSPGGSAEATESIVAILRARFSDIRFIIPSTAKSAATMLAMSGDRILMDEVSELGPTDPQLIFNRDGRLISSPAHAIKDQFAIAQEDISGDPSRLPGWVPLLREYAPSLIAECDNNIKLAHTLVTRWLTDYMFKDDDEGPAKAAAIAEYLGTLSNHATHSRRVSLEDLRDRGVNILDLRTEPALRTAVRELYHTIVLTFDLTGAVRMFENSQNEAMFTIINATATVEASPDPATPPAPPPMPPPQRPQGARDTKQPQLSRAERRRQGR